ncbi:MAG: DUF433 domain-containing protein [Candidatus Brocadiia bacterium]
MRREKWEKNVVISPDIHHGDPCIKGTRIPVAIIIGSLADGLSSDDIKEEYPQLTDTDIQAALAYAADLLHEEILRPITFHMNCYDETQSR